MVGEGTLMTIPKFREREVFATTILQKSSMVYCGEMRKKRSLYHEIARIKSGILQDQLAIIGPNHNSGDREGKKSNRGGWLID
jgi:hypothetical protein